MKFRRFRCSWMGIADLGRFDMAEDTVPVFKPVEGTTWVEVDGCTYPSLLSAYSSFLGLCGCGRPQDSYNLLRDMLLVLSFDNYHARQDRLKEFMTRDPEVTVETLLHLLCHLGVTEHGSSVYGSWLTAKGKLIVDGEAATEETAFGFM